MIFFYQNAHALKKEPKLVTQQQVHVPARTVTVETIVKSLEQIVVKNGNTSMAHLVKVCSLNYIDKK